MQFCSLWLSKIIFVNPAALPTVLIVCRVNFSVKLRRNRQRDSVERERREAGLAAWRGLAWRGGHRANETQLHVGMPVNCQRI